MKRYFCRMMAGIMLFAAFSCKDDPKITVEASFTTDKEVYDLGEDVVITNTSVVSNVQTIIYKWEYQGNSSYDETLTGLYYDEAGQYTIKLTITADKGAKNSSFEKTITVEDLGNRPTANFSYSPETVVAGETEVQFTDLSTSTEGRQITAWEWTFGTSTSTQQNPKYTFSEQGTITVTLTVTDNKGGKDTKSITIEVQKGAFALELAWSASYDNTPDAYVFGASPAVSHDGEFVYVVSTGYDLVCFTKGGERKWAFDVGKDGASARGGLNGTSSSIMNPTPTPSVDADGTVFCAAGYNYEESPSAYSGYMYAVTGGASGGSQKWVTAENPRAHMTFFTPTITDDYVIIAHRNGTVPGGSSHMMVYDKSGGGFVYSGHCNEGSRGGLLAMKNGKIIAGTGNRWGYRLFFPDGPGKWNFSPNNATGSNVFNLGYNFGSPNVHGSAYSQQPAAGPNGKIYLLFKNISNSSSYFADAPAGSDAVVVYYEDVNVINYQSTATDEDAPTLMPSPTWRCPIKGTFINANYGESGNGLAIAEDGTIYATACASEDGYLGSYLTAVTPQGAVKWEHQADGNIQGVPAIDNDGYIYYNDAVTGKLVMLNPENGNVVASIQLGEELRSSPTVSYDGTIYVTGMRESKPTVFAVRSEATGCAASWSQLGGNPSKTACMY